MKTDLGAPTLHMNVTRRHLKELGIINDISQTAHWPWIHTQLLQYKQQFPDKVKGRARELIREDLLVTKRYIEQNPHRVISILSGGDADARFKDEKKLREFQKQLNHPTIS